MDPSALRKIEQLKNLNKKAREEGNVVQSPFYNDEVNNPCIKEQNLSARCALENDADRTVCADYMENYVLCVRFWDMVKLKRQLNSEYPLLPLPEDREEIKKYYVDEYKKIAREIVAKTKRYMGVRE